jgi:hypothetical protein
MSRFYLFPYCLRQKKITMARMALSSKVSIFHHAMAARLTGDLPIPLGKAACKYSDLLAARLIYIN